MIEYAFANQCVCNKTHGICVNTLNNLSRSVRSVLFKDSCNMQIENWLNFSNTFNELEYMNFQPFCNDCLEVDEHVNPALKIEGRCMIKSTDKKFNENLITITNEIGGCIALLVTLTVLYIVKFIRKEMLRIFK